MVRKPEPKPTTWAIYRAAKKAVWMGSVKAADEREAIEKAANEFKVSASKLIAARRRSIA